MSITKTHTGVVITKDGEKKVQLHETATTWCVGKGETYRKEDGRRSGAPLTSRRLILSSIKPKEQYRVPQIFALPVERDENGCWIHPEYDKLCDGREHVPSEEFDAWLKTNGLEWDYELRDESFDFLDDAPYESDFSEWQPESPDGEGWFIGSIHDSEDGPVCIWFRQGVTQ